MATTSLYDEALKALPKPAVIEEIDIEAILSRMTARFLAGAERHGFDAREELLEGTPTMQQLEAVALEHGLIRQRINSAARADMLYFATGADLDHVLDEHHGIERLSGEPDGDAQNRARIRARGRSAAGPDDWWKDHALKADERVEDVAVVRRAAYPIPNDPNERGILDLYILGEGDSGIPSDEVLENVRAAVLKTDVKGTVVRPSVFPATSRGISIVGKVYLEANAPAGTFARLEPSLRGFYAAERRLGWEPTPRWITARLMQAGVYDIDLTSPTSSFGVREFETARIDSINLSLAGDDE